MFVGCPSALAGYRCLRLPFCRFGGSDAAAELGDVDAQALCDFGDPGTGDPGREADGVFVPPAFEGIAHVEEGTCFYGSVAHQGMQLLGGTCGWGRCQPRDGGRDSCGGAAM